MIIETTIKELLGPGIVGLILGMLIMWFIFWILLKKQEKEK